MTSMPLVTLVVVYRNEEKNLPDLLQSFSENLSEETENSFYFLFINNNSSDRSSQLVKNWLSSSRVRGRHIDRLKNNMAEARQQSLVKAQSSWVAFVDADSILDQGWFNDVAKVLLEATPETVVLGGGTRYQKTAKWHSFVEPLWNYFPLGKKQKQKVMVDHVPTNNYLVRRQAALRAGGFDGFFEQVGEDLDINVRLRKEGHLFYDPRFWVSHKLPGQLIGWYQKMALYGRAQSYVMVKYAGGVPREKFFPALLIIAIIGLAYMAPIFSLFLFCGLLLVKRTQFFLLTFLFYGLGEFVGLARALALYGLFDRTPHFSKKRRI